MKNILLIVCFILICISKSSGQLPNNSFETWNLGLPDGWFSSLIPGYNILEQSTDAHTGSYCAKLNVVDVTGFPFTASLIIGDGNSLTTPISYVPASVEFWYKMTVINGDQLSAVVFVYGGGAMVGLGSMQLNSAVSYTQASLPVLNITGATTADSINVTFLINNPAGSVNVGTTAQVDDVTLSVSSGVNYINNADVDLVINPNPVSDILNLVYESKKSNRVLISIYDANGKFVTSFNKDVTKGANQISFLANKFANGNYYCNLKTENQSITKLFIVKK